MPATQPEEPLKVMSIPWLGEGTKENTHALYRHTTSGKILNLGPTQPYKSPTNEMRGAPYKYADVTNDRFFNMYLNIIPGMHPFHWDLASMFVTAGAPILGAIDGVIDDSYIEDEVQKIYAAQPVIVNKPKFITISGEESNKEEPTLTESDIRGLYGDKFTPAIANYGHHNAFSFNYGLMGNVRTTESRNRELPEEYRRGLPGEFNFEEIDIPNAKISIEKSYKEKIKSKDGGRFHKIKSLFGRG